MSSCKKIIKITNKFVHEFSRFGVFTRIRARNLEREYWSNFVSRKPLKANCTKRLDLGLQKKKKKKKRKESRSKRIDQTKAMKINFLV